MKNFMKKRHLKLRRIRRHILIIFSLLLSQQLSSQIIDTINYSGYNGIKKLIMVQPEKGKISSYLDFVINPGHASLANTFFLGLHSQASLYTEKCQFDLSYAGMINQKWQSRRVSNVSKPTFTTGAQFGYNLIEKTRIKKSARIKGFIQRKSSQFKKGSIYGPRPTKFFVSPTVGLNFTQYESTLSSAIYYVPDWDVLNPDEWDVFKVNDSKLTYLSLGTSIRIVKSYSTISNNSEIQTYRGHRFQIYFLTAINSTYNLYLRSQWDSPWYYTPVDNETLTNVSNKIFGWAFKYDYFVKSKGPAGFNFGMSFGQLPHQIITEINKGYYTTTTHIEKGISLVAEFHIGLLMSTVRINK